MTEPWAVPDSHQQPQVPTSGDLRHEQMYLQNRMLARLAQPEFEQFVPHLTIAKLRAGDGIGDTRHLNHRLYFPLSGAVSFVVELEDGKPIETAMLGRDGVVGAWALYDTIAPNKVVVSIPGTAAVIAVAQARAISEASPGFRKLLREHVSFLFAQVQQTAACNAAHDVTQRLCRWLLRTRDLVGDQVPIKQDALAGMLGVRRSSISIVASQLQNLGAISYRRGKISITDVIRLEELSCECSGRLRFANQHKSWR